MGEGGKSARADSSGEKPGGMETLQLLCEPIDGRWEAGDQSVSHAVSERVQTFFLAMVGTDS